MSRTKKEPGEMIRHRLPISVVMQLREIADRQCCSMAAVMRQAISEWLQKRKKENG